MPEPIDTIRRVNNDKDMSVDQLQSALTVLNEHRFSGKVDVLQARRRVIRQLEKPGVEAATASAPPHGSASWTPVRRAAPARQRYRTRFIREP